MKINPHYKTLKWLILSSLMAGALTACPDAGTGQASFEVTGKSLGSSFVDGTSIQPAEAVVKNTSSIAGMPPQVSFNITSDLEFSSIDSTIYACDPTSETVLVCTAKDGAKLEGQAETSLKPLFDLAVKNVVPATALQSKTRQSIDTSMFSISIASSVLSKPIALSQNTATASASGFNLKIGKSVFQDFIAGGIGKFKLTATLLTQIPLIQPNYVTIQDPPPPTASGYSYNVVATNSDPLNNGLWQCSPALFALQGISCKLLPFTYSGIYPPLYVTVNVATTVTPAQQLNCSYVLPNLGDVDKYNNNQGVFPYTVPCTPYQAKKPDLAITKTQSAPLTTPTNSFYWGQKGQYEISVKNNSTGSVTNATFTDILTFLPGASPAFNNLTFTSTPPNYWNCTPTTFTTSPFVFTCTHTGTIPPGMLPSLFVNFDVKPYDPLTVPATANSETNCATLFNPSSPLPYNDANNQNNKSCIDSQNMALEGFDLDIKKTHTNTTVSPGGVVNYVLTVTNNGTGDAPGPITITDTLPAAFSSGSAVFVPSSAGACTGSPTIICTSNGSLAAGSNYIINVTATTNANATGNITNIATVSSYLPVGETTLQNNTSSDTLTLTNPQTKSDLEIRKSHENIPYKPGEVIHYFLTVTNNGPQAVTGAIVTDILPTPPFVNTPLVTASVSPTTAGTCSITFLTVTCTANPLAVGASFTVTINAATDLQTAPGTGIKNTATVSSPSNVDPIPANNTSTDSLTLATGCSGINANLNKALVGNVFVAGATAYYNFQFSNPCGPITSGPVTITDTLQNGLTRFDTVWSGPWSCNVSNPPTITCTYTGTFPIPSGYTSTNNIAIGVNIPNTPGVAIQNCATVNVPGDVNLTDNTSCITNTAAVSNP